MAERPKPVQELFQGQILTNSWKIKLLLAKLIEIIDIKCGLLSRVSQKIVATKWRIYKGKMFCQIGPLSRDRARILYLVIL